MSEQQQKKRARWQNRRRADRVCDLLGCAPNPRASADSRAATTADRAVAQRTRDDDDEPANDSQDGTATERGKQGRVSLLLSQQPRARSLASLLLLRHLTSTAKRIVAIPTTMASVSMGLAATALHSREDMLEGGDGGVNRALMRRDTRTRKEAGIYDENTNQNKRVSCAAMSLLRTLFPSAAWHGAEARCDRDSESRTLDCSRFKASLQILAPPCSGCHIRRCEWLRLCSFVLRQTAPRRRFLLLRGLCRV